ncbi:MAG: hypothetical protein M1831_002161 [Alyxoria varia]|nr:MAG: hypothetical protein M1831_002161 [Alyxoria varia]
MTTAHRPTFDPAQGREANRGPAYHQRLLPAHTHLKQRQKGQGGIGGLPESRIAQRDLRSELLKAEAAVQARKEGREIEAGDGAKDGETTATGQKRKLIGGGDDGHDPADIEDEDEDSESKRRRMILEAHHDEDADSDQSSDSESESEDSDEEDEEAVLMRELAKIKAERAAAREKQEKERAEREQEQREYEIAIGNPLLNGESEGAKDFGVKRRWDDDVVFKNQARGTEDKGRGKEFVNDLLRSDFHKKFMSKYVR